MTSNDAPVPGRRRRPLGRGPGTASPRPPEPPAEHPRPAAPRATEGESAGETGPAAAPSEPVRPPETAASPETAPEARPEPETERRAEAGAGTRAADASQATAGSRAKAGEDLRPQARPGPSSQTGEQAGEEAGGEAGEGTGGDGGGFTVRLANFEGPFDLLLQLISKHKLDVTEVALSRVTDDFMAHIRAMGPDWDLDETTEFLVVAATLLDLKAARLLPAAEVEDEADLALLEARDLLFARLLQYRAYKQVAELFGRRLEEESRRHPRTVGLEPHHAALLPDVVISIGAEGFARLAVKAMQPKPPPQVYVDHIHAPLVSVQEQAGIVVARLRELGQAGFRTLVEDAADTLTVVARFLALLELYREKAVALEQETAFGELVVRWTGGDGEALLLVTDEFDRPPGETEEAAKSAESGKSGKEKKA
ncbi:segregation and condensation protein A [Streptomyces thermoalcalitolerans]|uniref:Segregation and condensation protein A n=1 Tax=Streptomyces thermoalcalitolerans TaxID=65605 RepID=A0ABP3Z1L5_9ACTN